MKINRLCRQLAVCGSLVVFSACGGDSSGPAVPPGPDLSTPEGTIAGLEDFYSRRQSENAILLLGAGYRFIPALPESIPFLDPTETEWDRTVEVSILEELLVPERTTWIDQVLLEVTRRTKTTLPDGRVEILADVELAILVNTTPPSFEKARSLITLVFQPDADGDYRLLEEREELSDRPDIVLTVGEQKARALAGPGG